MLPMKSSDVLLESTDSATPLERLSRRKLSLNTSEKEQESHKKVPIEENEEAHIPQSPQSAAPKERRGCCWPAYSRTYFFFRDRPPKQAKLLLNSPTFRLRDWFHSALILRWYYQVLLILVVYMIVAGFFALLYLAGGRESIRDIEDPGDFLWLSIQTLTTVGYGRLEPATVYTHIVGALNALVGILLLSLTSGLVFTVVSKPNSRIIFAKNCVVEPASKTAKGHRRLHVRFVNARYSQLYDVNAFARLRMTIPDEVNGGLLFRSVTLKLSQEGHYPLVVYGRSFFHIVDEESPLYGKDQAWLERYNVSILVCFVCHDSDYNQTTACSTKYETGEIHFDHLYVNLRVHNPRNPDQFVLDVNNLDATFDPTTGIRALFQQLDTDSDGELSVEEVNSYLKQKDVVDLENMSFTVRHLLQHFNEMDKDKNGYLSWLEFQEAFLFVREHNSDHEHE